MIHKRSPVHVGTSILLSCVFSFCFGYNVFTCTTEVEKCPQQISWSNKSIEPNCKKGTTYICLPARGKILVEGCISNYYIPRGKLGCPLIDQCDAITKLPVLVSYNDFLPCSPLQVGCPEIGHQGYAISTIAKYAACIRKDIFITSSTPSLLGIKVNSTISSSLKVTVNSTMETETPGELDVAQRPTDPALIAAITLIVILLLVIAGFIAFFLKKRSARDMKQRFKSSSTRDDQCEDPSLEEKELLPVATSNIIVNVKKPRPGVVNGASTSTSGSEKNYSTESDDNISKNSATDDDVTHKSDSPEGNSFQWVLHCDNVRGANHCSNAVLLYCVTCVGNNLLCKECGKEHRKQFETHDVISYLNHSRKCCIHQECPVRRFCSQCQEYACDDCLMPSKGQSRHPGHALQKLSERIKDLLDILKPKCTMIVSAIECVKAEIIALSAKEKSITENEKIADTDKERIREQTQQDIKIKKMELDNLEEKRKFIRTLRTNKDIEQLENFLSSETQDQSIG